VLKKVDRSQPRPKNLKEAPVDPSSLSLAEILTKMAAIREDVAASASDDLSNSASSDSEW
jgi:hypothetical protein